MMVSQQAKVRFYVDADVRGLGIVLGGLRYDVTYPGDPGAVIHKRKRPPCPIVTTDLLDEEWIPEVARYGWLIITRDSKIAENRREIEAVREHGARMVALYQADAATKWRQLEVFMTRWRDIDALTAEPGPFIVRASRSGMTPIPLER